jgi:hypothetical protein
MSIHRDEGSVSQGLEKSNGFHPSPEVPEVEEEVPFDDETAPDAEPDPEEEWEPRGGEWEPGPDEDESEPVPDDLPWDRPEEEIIVDDEEVTDDEELSTAFRKSQGEGVCPRLTALKALFRKHYYFSDDDVIDVVLGVIAGNHFDSDPVWLHLIGPPSSGKTELLYSVFLCPETFFLSDMTPAALISGYKDPPEEDKPEKPKAKGKGKGKKGKGKVEEEEEEPAPPKDYSLLPKLDGKVVVTKDFSVIHDKPSETRAQVLSILRDVYDGYASRGFGNSEPKGFFSRFNYLTGMTPDIEKSWSLNTLGERFLMYRISISDRHAHARRAIENAVGKGKGKGKGTASARAEIQAAVKQFLEGVVRSTPEVGDGMIERIVHLANVLSTARTYVHRNKNDELLCPVAPELGARVGKQLVRIGQGLALVRGRSEVGDEEFAVMRRIALDSLPSNRRRLLAELWACREEPLTVDGYADQIAGVSKTTVRRELHNLVELGAVSGRMREVTVLVGGKEFAGAPNGYVYELAKGFRRSAEIVGGLVGR